MKVIKHLRPGDWIVTSLQEVGESSWLRLQGLLLGIVRRPHHDAGNIAYVLSAVSGINVVAESNIIERWEP